MALLDEEETMVSFTNYIDFSGTRHSWEVQNEDYDKETNPGVDKKIEISVPFTVAIDIENIEQGWVHWSNSENGWSADWIVWENGTKPEKPSSEYKEAFRVLMYSTKHFGKNTTLVAFRKDTWGVKQFLRKLYNESSKEFGKGKVPIIEISRAKSEKFASGRTSAVPQFEIKNWVDRGDKFVEGVDSSDQQPDIPSAPQASVKNVEDTFDESEIKTVEV